MSKQKKDTDYLHLSARIRVMENRLLTQERMEQMIEARDASEAAKVLAECGYPDLLEATPVALEVLLGQAQAELFADLGKTVNDPDLLDAFRCKYDYHNAKVLVKSEALGSEQDRLLLEGGRWNAGTLAEDYRREDLSAYSAPFQEGVAQAREVLGASGDPQRADLILDRAYYQELTNLVKKSGSPFLAGYASVVIDSANLRSAVRCARLDKGQEFLRQVLVPGGSVPVDRLVLAQGADLGALFRDTTLAQAAEVGAALAVPGGGALTDFERLCDDGVMAYLARARKIPFGEQIIIGYLYAREAEATAIRIILAGRMAGLDGATIRQRLRQTYG